MPGTAYRLALRTLACANCGAPIDVPLEGGSVTCGYCGQHNVLAGREPRPAPLDRAGGLSESERIARLRSQETGYERQPPSLEPFLNEQGELHRPRDPSVAAEWTRARVALEASPSFLLSDRLFRLTLGLVPHCEPRRQRALLETALELLPDEGHQHVLRCTLSRLAARSGDLGSAADWLAGCESRPLELTMDTAYRYARATMAAAAGDHSKVVALLGSEPGDLPLSDRDALPCGLLRAHALGETGAAKSAARQLDELHERVGGTALARAFQAQEPLELCARWRRKRAEADRAEELAQLSARRAVLAPLARMRELMLESVALAVVFALMLGLVAATVVRDNHLDGPQSHILLSLACGGPFVVAPVAAIVRFVIQSPRRRREARALDRQIDDLKGAV